MASLPIQTPFDKATNLTGRVALVTGGGTGVGLMIAKALASRGATVYVTGRRVDVLHKATTLQFQGPGQIRSIPMDVTDKSSIIDVVQRISDTEGKLHILVNNAGDGGPVDESTKAATEQKVAKVYGDSLFQNQAFGDWGKLLSLNVSAVFFVTTAFMGLLEASTKDAPGSTASIINISSAIAHMHLSYARFAYCASKGALGHLTKVMASDFALKGIPIRVNEIAPGRFLSELSYPQEVEDEMAQRAWLALSPPPVKRIGREEEMGATAIYLASDASGFMNGQSILIDGGLSMVNP